MAEMKLSGQSLCPVPGCNKCPARITRSVKLKRRPSECRFRILSFACRSLPFPANYFHEFSLSFCPYRTIVQKFTRLRDFIEKLEIQDVKKRAIDFSNNGKIMLIAWVTSSHFNSFCDVWIYIDIYFSKLFKKLKEFSPTTVVLNFPTNPKNFATLLTFLTIWFHWNRTQIKTFLTYIHNYMLILRQMNLKTILSSSTSIDYVKEQENKL